MHVFLVLVINKCKKTKTYFSRLAENVNFQFSTHDIAPDIQDFMAKLPDQTVITLRQVMNPKTGILVTILQKYHDFS